MDSVLIDTNVIIDALAAREPFRSDAETLLTLAAEEKFLGYVTGSGVTDIYYLVRKILSHDETIDALKTLLQALRVVSVGEDECVEALESGMADFEDAVVAVCAKRVEAKYIVSRDEGFAKAAGSVIVLSPGSFLAKL